MLMADEPMTAALMSEFRTAIVQALEKGASHADFRKQVDVIVLKHSRRHDH